MASQQLDQLDLLAPFGTKPEDKWFRTAYKWNRDEIFAWMNKIAVEGGVEPGNQATGGLGGLLTEIYNLLRNLSLPNGRLYKDNTKRPWSHIARLVNRNWNKDDKNSSRFKVSPWSFSQTMQTFMNTRPDWWCPYDLLGLFLSLLGPAPAAANKNNFYLPLTAVYGRWCSRIAGRPQKSWRWKTSAQGEIRGEGDLPYVFQCTWRIIVDESTKQHSGQYFLGASTAGDSFEKTKTSQRYTGSWRKKVQEARFNMLFTCQKISMVQKNDFKAPNMVPYGNCGETYPFAILFSGDKTKNGNSMAGLALRRDFMEEGEYPEYPEYASYESSHIWKSLLGPCEKCRNLLEQAGADKAKFDHTVGRNKAPINPSKSLPKAEQELVNG